MLRNNTPPPGVVLLELQPQAVRQHGYEGGALGLLRKMHSWGYTDVSHSGCASFFADLPFAQIAVAHLEHAQIQGMAAEVEAAQIFRLPADPYSI